MPDTRHMFHRSRYLVRVSVALVLSVGYAYTAFIMLVGVRVMPSHRELAWRWPIIVVSTGFAAWHALGYLGRISDNPRKVGYLISGAWLGGFTGLLWADDARLAAGYVALACGISIAAYWQYPRRHEGDDAVEQ